MRESKKRRKGIVIMRQLTGLVKPLIPVMCAAVFLGVLGYLCAIFLTVIAGYELLGRIFEGDFYSVGNVAVILLILAVLRGIFHYGEQYCNHFIAFKLLAVIRHKVFAALRKLCPAKLEGRERGNLISIITSDIELLEVFYAHTISPIFLLLPQILNCWKCFMHIRFLRFLLHFFLVLLWFLLLEVIMQCLEWWLWQPI